MPINVKRLDVSKNAKLSQAFEHVFLGVLVNNEGNIYDRSKMFTITIPKNCNSMDKWFVGTLGEKDDGIKMVLMLSEATEENMSKKDLISEIFGSCSEIDENGAFILPKVSTLLGNDSQLSYLEDIELMEKPEDKKSYSEGLFEYLENVYERNKNNEVNARPDDFVDLAGYDGYMLVQPPESDYLDVNPDNARSSTPTPSTNISTPGTETQNLASSSQGQGGGMSRGGAPKPPGRRRKLPLTPAQQKKAVEDRKSKEIKEHGRELADDE